MDCRGDIRGSTKALVDAMESAKKRKAVILEEALVRRRRGWLSCCAGHKQVESTGRFSLRILLAVLMVEASEFLSILGSSTIEKLLYLSISPLD